MASSSARSLKAPVVKRRWSPADILEAMGMQKRPGGAQQGETVAPRGGQQAEPPAVFCPPQVKSSPNRATALSHRFLAKGHRQCCQGYFLSGQRRRAGERCEPECLGMLSGPLVRRSVALPELQVWQMLYRSQYLGLDRSGSKVHARPERADHRRRADPPNDGTL